MKVDFRMTADGDLEIGSPRFNKWDELVYVDPAGNETTDPAQGQLIRDIPLSVSYHSEKQVILNRLRTENPDWHHHPTIGSDLSELIGMPNTRETAQKGVELIERCLCADKFILSTDLSIRPIPLNQQEILFHISVERPIGTVLIPITFNLEHGLLTEYSVTP